jgi:hypothetical protein
VFTGHYTGHFKAVVAKPQNVKVLRDVMANGYRAGGNAKFFAPDGDLRKAKEAIMKRLAFEDGENEDYPASLLAFPMKRTQYDNKCQTVMSLTSRLLPWEVQGGTHDSFPGGEEGFKVYEPLLSLRQVHFGTRSSVFVAQCPTSFSLISVAECILTFVCSDALLCRRGPPCVREHGTLQQHSHMLSFAMV